MRVQRLSWDMLMLIPSYALGIALTSEFFCNMV